MEGQRLRRPGADLPRIGDYNELVVLQAVRQDAGISRAAVADRTGLARQTVSGLVRRLLDADLLERPLDRNRVELTGDRELRLELSPFAIGTVRVALRRW